MEKPRNPLEKRAQRQNISGLPLAAGLLVGLTALTVITKYTKEQTNVVLEVPPSKPPTPSKTFKEIKGTIKLPDPDQPVCIETKLTSEKNDDAITGNPILFCDERSQPLVKIYQVLDDPSQAVEYPNCKTYVYQNSIVPIKINTEYDVDLEYDHNQPFLVYFPEKETPEAIIGSTICR